MIENLVPRHWNFKQHRDSKPIKIGSPDFVHTGTGIIFFFLFSFFFWTLGRVYQVFVHLRPCLSYTACCTQTYCWGTESPTCPWQVDVNHKASTEIGSVTYWKYKPSLYCIVTFLPCDLTAELSLSLSFDPLLLHVQLLSVYGLSIGVFLQFYSKYSATRV